MSVCLRAALRHSTPALGQGVSGVDHGLPLPRPGPPRHQQRLPAEVSLSRPVGACADLRGSVSVDLCVDLSMWICRHGFAYEDLSIWTCLCGSMWMCLVDLIMWIHVCGFVCVDLSVWICLHKSVCIDLSMWIYLHIYVCMYLSR